MACAYPGHLGLGHSKKKEFCTHWEGRSSPTEGTAGSSDKVEKGFLVKMDWRVRGVGVTKEEYEEDNGARFKVVEE